MSDEIHSQPWSSWQMAEQWWVLLFCRFDRICTACTSWRYSPEISWSCVRRPVPQLAGRPSGSWRTLQDRSWSPISAGGGRAVFLMSMLPSKLIINYNSNFHHQHNQMERIATTWVKYLFTKHSGKQRYAVVDEKDHSCQTLLMIQLSRFERENIECLPYPPPSNVHYLRWSYSLSIMEERWNSEKSSQINIINSNRFSQI